VDIKVQQAREHHARSLEKEAEAGREREQRDRLIRQIRDDDPARWSYSALAKAVGCSRELIAYIVADRKRALLP
jgi:AraC-like DNA-binding protein